MDKAKIQEGVKLILEGIGEDIHREGLVETPDRIARMYEELAAGYTDDAAVHLKKRFHVDNNDMVMEKDIHFYSFCKNFVIFCFFTYYILVEKIYKYMKGSIFYEYR